MGKGNKRVVIKEAPPNKKRPSFDKQIQSKSTSFNKLSPIWEFKVVDENSPWGWEGGARILPKLGKFETMTWNEILVKAKKQNHTVHVSKLTPKALKRRKELNLDDHEEFVSLHFSGTERLWGIRDESKLRIIWWDPKHEICPSLLS